MGSKPVTILVVYRDTRGRQRLQEGLARRGHRVVGVADLAAVAGAGLRRGEEVVALLDAQPAKRTRPAQVHHAVHGAGGTLLGVLLRVDSYRAAAKLADAPGVLDVVLKRASIAQIDQRLRWAVSRTRRGQALHGTPEMADWQLRALYDAVPFPLFVKNRQRRFTMVNRSYLDFFGVDRDWLMGRRFEDIPGRSPAETARVREAEARVLASGIADMSGDVQEPNGEGQRRTIWKVVHPLRNTHGKITGLIGMMEDVTERQRTMERLRENEETLKQAQRIAHIANWTWDIQAGTVTWCDEIYRIFGFDPARTVPSLERMLAAVHPADQAAMQERLHGAVAANRAYRSDHRIILPDGTERYVQEQGQLFGDADGRAQRMLGVVMDVTERTHAEQERFRLATAVEQAGDAIFITDIKGRIQYVNHAFERITGYSLEEVRGQPPSILKSGRQGAEFYRTLWESLSRGEVWQGRYINRRKDGAMYHSHATIAPVCNERGETTNFVSVQRDISQVLRMEEQLQRAQRIEAIATLTGGIAHDFNNILTPIIGFTQLTLGMLERGSRAHGNLELVKAAAERAKQLVTQIRRFSQEREHELAIVEVPALCREVVALIRSTASKSIRIEEDLDAAVPPVYGDAGSLHRALTNLCVNACQSMPKGGTLRVSVATADFAEAGGFLGEPGPGKYVCIQVQDTGSGMDDATKARLFEPYFTTKDSGTGLGLYSAYGTIRQHQGGIRVQSQLGLGTLFEVALPVTELPQALAAKAEWPLAAGHERILVVDDEEAIARLVRASLEPLGYRVETFTDPVAALAAFRAGPDGFHLVVTDLAMPQLAGDELLAELRGLRPHLPVIVMTGMCDEDTATALREMGAGQIIRKPFDQAELAAHVRTMLDGAAVRLDGATRPGQAAGSRSRQ